MDIIKANMLKSGEYGEFFPPQYLPFPYRTTMVAYYYGFWDYDNAAKYGYDVSPVNEYGGETITGEVINSEDLPDDINDAKDDVLNKIIYDAKNNKKFRYIKQELDFYRKYSLPLPRENPASRMSAWRKEFGLTVSFYRRDCPKCGKEFETTFAPDRPEKSVWCEACYLEVIG